MQTKILRNAYVEMIESCEPNLAMTLGVGRGGITPLTFHTCVKHFFNKQRRIAFGRNWHLRDGDLVAFGFMEHFDANGHMHFALTVPDQRLQHSLYDGEMMWRRTRPAGDFYCADIDDMSGYVRYIVKDFWDPRSQESGFIYDSRPRDSRRKRKL